MYTADRIEPRTLHARLTISPFAHARIAAVDASEARRSPGVRAVLTGDASDVLIGEEIRDRPVIARDRVRYNGEIVAVVVADTEAEAMRAANLIRVRYEPLPVVNDPVEALRPSAPILHEKLAEYQKGEGVVSIPGTNVASIIRVLKGDMDRGWAESETIVENRVSFAPSDHAAMETRSASAEIRPDGHVIIETSTQVPFAVKKFMARYFGIDPGWIVVRTPFVGGGYGGKTAIQLEAVAYLASRAVGGRKVKLVNTREEDMLTSPVRIGLDATVRLGSTRDGKIRAAQIVYRFDGGAYNDKSSDVARAAAADCSGPYGIEHLHCECLTVYTNHTFPAAFRGYGHSELTFAMERAIDALADELKMDPWELRMRNAAVPGDTAPTRDRLTPSNLGDIRTCLNRVRSLAEWDDWQVRQVNEHTVRAKGIACFWKNSSMDTDATSGAILLFNSDGSVNLVTGVVEIGTGTKTVLAQMVAERLRMSVDRVHVKFTVDTLDTPEHWKTVASRGTFLAGRAALKAADDAIRQLKSIAAVVLRADPDDLELAHDKVFVRADPAVQIAVKDICYGYKYPNGNAIGGQIVGRGYYTQRRMNPLNPATGEGTPGPEWNVGAQAVEIEMDTRDCSYRLVKAISVNDAGKVLNPKGALGQVTGAMAMGLSYASREAFYYTDNGTVLNPTLRDFTLLRFGENPEYVVEFIENPCLDAPFGARAMGEHGLIAMPAALASAVSRAAGVRLNRLPLFPETVWRAKNGGIG
ncbi:xanthine dehydrogenase family protein molybdopterin-binding subunit [Cohnella thermotolerans]|uniref:xanthine dehydrogenase family protein molybdopterin-binding subunit n=1 Tax=Cohnella thermotolerans TaxID=329858 RepID=UPI0006845C98|nr:xanthine dehydrogenase family protein molybdopterin-binding subunit [Cohnella thermotolerans]